MIRQLQNEHPNAGYRIMWGMLAARGFHVQEQRIREAMIRVDPLGVTLCPNALWHIDGNHALVR